MTKAIAKRLATLATRKGYDATIRKQGHGDWTGSVWHPVTGFQLLTLESVRDAQWVDELPEIGGRGTLEDVTEL